MCKVHTKYSYPTYSSWNLDTTQNSIPLHFFPFFWFKLNGSSSFRIWFLCKVSEFLRNLDVCCFTNHNFFIMWGTQLNGTLFYVVNSFPKLYNTHVFTKNNGRTNTRYLICFSFPALAALAGHQNRPQSSQQTHEMTVPNELIGCIIGKGGSKIAEIR